MSRLHGQKRKQTDSNSPAQSLTEHERVLYNVIRSKQDMGQEFDKRGGKHPKQGEEALHGNGFEPSKEITGGAWYVDGNLDTEFIQILKEQCTKQIYKLKVATLEGVTDSIRRSGVLNVELTKQQIEEIVKALVLDDEIIEVKSNGMGEFASIPVGKICYKCIRKGSIGGEPKTGAMASIPCGVCPRMRQLIVMEPSRPSFVNITDRLVSFCFGVLYWQMGEVKDNDAYEEELLDYEEEVENAPDSVSAKAAAESAKKGYVGIHSSGFRDFLLKPELLRAIVDSGFEHPSEGKFFSHAFV
ncbi:hypothetical protein GH714_034323 [Hevea brasiliensis]|uniref:DEAD-box RNA helicase Q domain-containing protein n=1 Tax=Hevea brasiliensis TaxID=3981 RepID=A0A6A6NDK5_HEVBR|nr:hypothetical protein GH714_034323 [Hevea brasiliensis]